MVGAGILSWRVRPSHRVNPLHLGQYLVNRFGSVPGGITPMKLQKLLYYVQAWSEVDGRAGLVEGEFRKWPHGPVLPAVYHHFKAHGRQPLQPMTLGPGQEPTGDDRALAEFIGASYVRFPAVTLSVMTHREDPWRLTPDGAVIPTALMQAYYAGQPFARNRPFQPDAAKPYYPVQSDLDRAFTMDLAPADAARATTYVTFAEYLAQVDRLQNLGADRDGMLSGLLR